MQTNCGSFNVEIRDGACCRHETWASLTLAHLFQIEKSVPNISHKREIKQKSIATKLIKIIIQFRPKKCHQTVSFNFHWNHDLFFFRCQCNSFDSPSMELCRDKQEKKSCFKIKTAESNRQLLISCVRETTFTYLYDIICITINCITLLEMP